MKTERIHVGNDGLGMLSGTMFKYVSEVVQTDLMGPVKYVIETHFDSSYGRYEYVFVDGNRIYQSNWCDLMETFEEPLGPVPMAILSAMVQHRESIAEQEDSDYEYE